MMDQLSSDSTMALRLGMSYGKFKALQHEGILPSCTAEKQFPVAVEKYRKDTLCKICGKPVPNTRRNYCSGPCADIANRETAKMKWRRHTRRKNKIAVCVVPPEVRWHARDCDTGRSGYEDFEKTDFFRMYV